LSLLNWPHLNATVCAVCLTLSLLTYLSCRCSHKSCKSSVLFLNFPH